MFISRLKKHFDESISGKIYYKLLSVPLIKLFFDFDYAFRLWNESFIKNKTELLLIKFEKQIPFNPTDKKRYFFAILLSLCPFLELWTMHPLHIIVLTIFLSIFFLLTFKGKSVEFVLLYEMVLTLFFFPFIKLSLFMYIIYVESAVILFFLIKNTDNFTLNILLKASAILWFVQSLFIKGNEGGLIISLLPYTLCGYSKKNILRFGYSALVLCVGLYALAALGNSALAGGGICILIMIILGEFYLLPLIAVISPWIIGMGIKVVQGGLNGKNIIKIGYFFWNRGFRGASPEYTSISFGTFGIFVSLLFSVISFIFFWYVLRVSRQAILKLFKKGTKNKSLIRAGLSAVIGFSFYTFFTKTENLHSNILIYLWNCALLKRMSRLSQIREETGANGRKKDLS